MSKASIYRHNDTILPVGTQVKKISGKPFKSTLKINTIKSIITHPQINRPAYTFFEDDSIVATRSVIGSSAVSSSWPL